MVFLVASLMLDLLYNLIIFGTMRFPDADFFGAGIFVVFWGEIICRN